MPCEVVRRVVVDGALDVCEIVRFDESLGFVDFPDTFEGIVEVNVLFRPLILCSEISQVPLQILLVNTKFFELFEHIEQDIRAHHEHAPISQSLCYFILIHEHLLHRIIFES